VDTQSANVLTEFTIPGVPKFKSGKVREVFDLGTALLLVATDRISAFDCVLPTGVPGKGCVLNQLSAWWFDRTRHKVPNHMVTTEVETDSEAWAAQSAQLVGRSMIVKKTQALPVECVVRVYLVGSGWKEYRESGTVSGIRLRPGYQMAERLDEPLFTPAIKVETGHDENISFEQVEEMVGSRLAAQLRAYSLDLYGHAYAYARERGILIADTKFEFGLLDDRLLLIDEMLTPDSSRFWPVEGYTPGRPPPSFDKQFVRDYLERQDWNKTPPAPPLPEDVVRRTSAKYREAYRRLTGKDLPR